MFFSFKHFYSVFHVDTGLHMQNMHQFLHKVNQGDEQLVVVWAIKQERSKDPGNSHVLEVMLHNIHQDSIVFLVLVFLLGNKQLQKQTREGETSK